MEQNKDPRLLLISFSFRIGWYFIDPFIAKYHLLFRGKGFVTI